MFTDGFHLYRVDFVYRQESYSCEFYSTVEITTESDRLVVWGIVDDAIKERMSTIAKKKGIYPHSIVVSGDFGSLTIKE